jgi:hypothetical protein
MKLKIDKPTLLLIFILGLGLVLRAYKAVEYLPFGHDHDLASWIIKDIVVNKHVRLIGQETSTQGVFIGALYYYLLIPFYFLTRLEPTGGIFLSLTLSLLSILSFYFVFKSVFKKKEVGLIAAFLVAVSSQIVWNDRGVVPTMPVVVWSVWFLYGLWGIFSGKITKSLVLLGILVSLIWHLNVTLALLTVLIPISLVLKRWKFNLRQILPGLGAFFVSSIPFFLFEARHGLVQTRAVIASFSSNQGSELTALEQLKRVLHIFSQIVSNLVWYPPQRLSFLLPLLLATALVFLTIKKAIDRGFSAILIVWTLVILTFFSLYSKNVSEYYLFGVLVVWLTVLTLSVFQLLKSKKYKPIGVLFLVVFAAVNINQLLGYRDAREGYLFRKALVSQIKADSLKHNYPCIAISYITKPGYDLGYRYLFWLENMHVNRPSSGSPVYTIVFPLNDVLFPADKSFGALGLIYPDHKRYTKKVVEQSCSGQNSNLTDPMFGYTE